MPTSKVKSVMAGDQFNSKYGIMYNYLYEFEDGFRGKAAHKENKPKYEVGQEATYTVSPDAKEFNGFKQFSFDSGYSGGGGGSKGGWTPAKPHDMVNVNACLGRAIEFMAFVPEKDRTKENAIKLTDYFLKEVIAIHKKYEGLAASTEQVKAVPQPPAYTEASVHSDELPF